MVHTHDYPEQYKFSLDFDALALSSQQTLSDVGYIYMHDQLPPDLRGTSCSKILEELMKKHYWRVHLFLPVIVELNVLKCFTKNALNETSLKLHDCFPLLTGNIEHFY